MYMSFAKRNKTAAITKIFCIYPKYSGRQAWANSVDPDQTPQGSDYDLHCLAQQFLDINRRPTGLVPVLGHGKK